MALKEFTDTTTGIQHLIERLANWKFCQAQNRVKQHRLKLPSETREVIDALASAFGDSGWMDDCAMAIIVGEAVDRTIETLRQIEDNKV